MKNQQLADWKMMHCFLSPRKWNTMKENHLGEKIEQLPNYDDEKEDSDNRTRILRIYERSRHH